MSQTPAQPRPPSPVDYWNRPYAERRILAGFLRPQDVPRVYPASSAWPADIAASLQALYGASDSLAPCPEAGRCRVDPVAELEAQEILHPIAMRYPADPNMPISFSWIEIDKLIAVSATTDALPYLDATPLEPSDLSSVASFSLMSPVPTGRSGPEGISFSSSVDFQPAIVVINGSSLVYQYPFTRSHQPIVVGYEGNRVFLLNEYARVLHAMNRGVDRLLCLVHYGLDLNAGGLGVRLPFLEAGLVNHFGASRLNGARPPLVKDFLDPSLSAVFPVPASFTLVRQILNSCQINPPSVSQGMAPLSDPA